MDRSRDGDGVGDSSTTRRVLICNPTSGSEDHVEHVLGLADEYGLETRLTAREGDATRLARAAANAGAELVVAAGGDGTINEVINGLVEADAPERPTLAVVPAGTGNNFASNIGIDDAETAFDLLESGERRRLDLGVANDRVFINSCVGGVTAVASDATTSERKREFGILAYVLSMVETVTSFEPLDVRITFEDETTRASDAIFVLVGNCRRFTGARRAQANAEDGLFEVTVVEEASTVGLVGEATLERLVDQGPEHIVRRRVSSLTIESGRAEPIAYSLDGEALEARTLELSVEAAALSVLVGDRYRPDPDEPTEGVDDSPGKGDESTDTADSM